MLKAFLCILVNFDFLGVAYCYAVCPDADFCLLAKAALCSLPLALVCASPVLILGKWSYLLLFPLLLLASLNVAVAYALNRWCGGLSGEGLFVSLLMVTLPEAIEFASNHFCLKTLLVACACVSVGVGEVVWLLSLRDCKGRGVRPRLYVLIGALFCSMIVPAMTGDDFLMMVMELKQFKTRSDFLDVYLELKEGGKQVAPADYHIKDKSITGVFVIGESASRLHWSLYGYGRDTTPFMQSRSDEMIAFSNLQCTAYYTPYALRDLFTMRDKDAHLASLPSIINAVGLDTVFLSAQSRMGLYDGADQLLFHQCAKKLYREDITDGVFYDEALVPLVRAEICVTNCPMTFVHLMGSHFEYSMRYPKSAAVFTVNETNVHDAIERSIISYDNSIAYTDRILDQIISVLEQSGKRAFLVYVSDHGESPESHMRDEASTSLSAIPFLIWMSPSFRNEYPDRVRHLRSLNNVKMVSSDCMPIFLDLLGIECRKRGVEHL